MKSWKDAHLESIGAKKQVNEKLAGYRSTYRLKSKYDVISKIIKRFSNDLQ